MVEAQGRGMRAAMPQCAELIDWLRGQLPREWVDGALRRATRGAPAGYLAEVDAAGGVIEWGRAPSGRVAVLADGGLQMVRRPGGAAAVGGDRRGLHGAHGKHRG